MHQRLPCRRSRRWGENVGPVLQNWNAVLSHQFSPMLWRRIYDHWCSSRILWPTLEGWNTVAGCKNAPCFTHCHNAPLNLWSIFLVRSYSCNFCSLHNILLGSWFRFQITWCDHEWFPRQYVNTRTEIDILEFDYVRPVDHSMFMI